MVSTKLHGLPRMVHINIFVSQLLLANCHHHWSSWTEKLSGNRVNCLIYLVAKANLQCSLESTSLNETMAFNASKNIDNRKTSPPAQPSDCMPLNGFSDI